MEFGLEFAQTGHLALATLHANCPELAQAVLDEAAERIPNVETVFSELSPVIGTHTGPGAVGLAYYYDN